MQVGNFGSAVIERAKAREWQRAYYATHKEKKNEASKLWRRDHPERVRARKRNYRLTHLEDVRERDREWYRAWLIKNPGANRAKEARRRALLKQQRCKCCTDAEIQEIHNIAALCGRGAEVDHRTPLALGGLDCVHNLEALTYEEHKEKTRRDNGMIAAARRRSRAASSSPAMNRAA